MKGSNRDHKTLKPHPNIHEQGNDEHHRNTRSTFFKPEDLWDNNVTGRHGPVGPPIRTKRAINKSKTLERISTVPGNEKFTGVRVADQHPRTHDHLVHFFQMRQRNVVF